MTRTDDVNLLEKNIYEILRNKLIEWRESNITRWNWSCQQRLQDVIKQ